jgi:hypothetical protein
VDLVFGCLDGYAARRDLEEFTRRYLIPLVDIGLDVHVADDENAPQMSGQVIVSMTDGPCMWRLGFLNDVVIGAKRRWGVLLLGGLLLSSGRAL